jgi:flagellar hook-basal body complex protein FliE
MATPITAASAYANIARLTSGVGGNESAGTGAVAGNPAADFSSMLKEAMTTVQDMGHKSDAQSRALAAGKANMVDVVTAVSETEVAIDAVVAVRDRVISAYEEIMRMAI